MNTITTEQPINNQSFFKLPLIFIAVFFVVYFIGTQISSILIRDISLNDFIIYASYSLFSFLLPLCLFFITAIFCCQKYRLFYVAESWRIIMLIAVIFSILYFGCVMLFDILYRFVFSELREIMETFNMLLWMTIFGFFINIVVSISFVFVLSFLFFVLTNKKSPQRAMFTLTREGNNRVYSIVYSVMMLFLFVFMMPFFNLALRMMAIYWNIDYIDTGEPICLLITLFTFCIYYTLFYFSTRHCFKRIDSTVKLGRMIITVLVTNLFLLTPNVVMLVCITQYLIMIYYTADSFSTPTLIIIFNVINLLLLPIFSRLSVKIMYS